MWIISATENKTTYLRIRINSLLHIFGFARTGNTQTTDMVNLMGFVVACDCQFLDKQLESLTFLIHMFMKTRLLFPKTPLSLLLVQRCSHKTKLKEQRSWREQTEKNHIKYNTCRHFDGQNSVQWAITWPQKPSGDYLIS